MCIKNIFFQENFSFKWWLLGIWWHWSILLFQVEIRPMMYVALTYDHRLIDGREAVTFLRRVKSAVEDPRVLLLDL